MKEKKENKQINEKDFAYEEAAYEKYLKEDAAYEKYLEEEYRYSSTRLGVKSEQFKTSPQEWNNSRIAVSLDSIKDKLKYEQYVVRVEKDGLLTYATSDAVFDVQRPEVNKPVEIRSPLYIRPLVHLK